MKIIFAQGNPGPRYEKSRHNVGFEMLERFVASYDGSWVEKSKFQAYVSEITVGDQKVICVKPTTFYNETGQSARALVDFYKLNPTQDFLVIHDELALPFGTVRVRSRGSDAGNNGVKSLNAHIGENYTRIRIGINKDQRTSDDASFVLDRFDATEAEQLPTLSKSTNDLIHQFIVGTLEHSSSSL